MKDAHPILLLTGPTSVGKTALSLALAAELDAEIISADSRQVYIGMDIGTAKPSAEERAQVNHHLIDERRIDEPYSAGLFLEEASERISSIEQRGRTPLVVGGSTLYVHALQHGLANVPQIPHEVRASVQWDLECLGPDTLFAELIKVDPRAADRMDATKTQRLVRAVEVYRATGRSLSSYHDEQTRPAHRFHTLVLYRDRRELYGRINARVDEMLARGLLGEVRHLLELGYTPDLNPLRTIGYQEPITYLQSRISYDEMVRLIKRNSRRYAKRQLTWFRRDPDHHWLDASQPFDRMVADVLRHRQESEPLERTRDEG